MSVVDDSLAELRMMSLVRPSVLGRGLLHSSTFQLNLSRF